MRGPLFEGWIGQLLRAYGESASGTGHPFDGLWYWAPVYLGDRPQHTEDGIEVLPLQGLLAALEEGALW